MHNPFIQISERKSAVKSNIGIGCGSIIYSIVFDEDVGARSKEHLKIDQRESF
jgi:hypothetical protein